MFDQYFQLGHRLRKHYLSPHVFFCLVTGGFVPPIDRRSLYSMQYSMLPARRDGMAEVWARLTEKSSGGSSVTNSGMLSNGVGSGAVKLPNGFGMGSGRRGYR
jgi:phosphatidylinositol glycan class Q protein